MANYSELLKDPRWQRKRLEIFQLDAFQCRDCNSKEKMLNVHHLYYLKDALPWEYPNSALVTLCSDCHERARSTRWQQAFLDLNATERDLLEIATMLHYRKMKFEERMKDFHKEKNIRTMYTYMYYNLFEPGDDVDEFYNGVHNEIFNKYHG